VSEEFIRIIWVIFIIVCTVVFTVVHPEEETKP
jgi:hypothetical protein